MTKAGKSEIEIAQAQAYRWTFLESGMTHPNFAQTFGELKAATGDRAAVA